MAMANVSSAIDFDGVSGGISEGSGALVLSDAVSQVSFAGL